MLEIELDKRIISITENMPLPVHLAEADEEVKMGVNKTEAFADDTNGTCKQRRSFKRLCQGKRSEL